MPIKDTTSQPEPDIDKLTLRVCVHVDDRCFALLVYPRCTTIRRRGKLLIRCCHTACSSDRLVAEGSAASYRPYSLFSGAFLPCKNSVKAVDPVNAESGPPAPSVAHSCGPLFTDDASAYIVYSSEPSRCIDSVCLGLQDTFAVDALLAAM